MSRFPLACILVGLVVRASAGGGLVSQDARELLRSAAQERNHSKAEAMLRGLLIPTISVGIDGSTLTAVNAVAFREGAMEAVDAWNSGAHQNLFKLEPTSVTADIAVHFVSSIDGSFDLQGNVVARRHYYWKGRVEGSQILGDIHVVDRIDGRSMSAEEVSRVIGHELGHLLGLDDDPNGSGLMSDFVAGPGQAHPSEAELSAVLELRRQAAAQLDKLERN